MPPLPPVLGSLARIAVGVVVALGAGVVCLGPLGPCHTCSSRNGNEGAAIATLKIVASAEHQFVDAEVIDLDGDGRGGYGWFRELAGAVPPRGRERPLAEPLLSNAFAKANAGELVRSGYRFELRLPAVGGGQCREGDGAEVDEDLAEVDFEVIAEPQAGAGRRTFRIDASGQVSACTSPGRPGAVWKAVE